MKKVQPRKYSIKVPKTEYSRFSDRLVLTMCLRGCSVEELARKIFVSKSAVCNYRTGSRLPDIHKLGLIAQALHVSTDFLLGLEEYIYI